MDDCIFCKIVKGEIPSSKVYETDKILAFLDINPVNKGHALVISKDHFIDIHDTPEDVMSEIMKAAKKLSSAIKKSTGADGINIHMNNEKASGQIIFHTHVHVIPRFLEDGFEEWHGRKPYSEGEKDLTAQKITAAL